MQSENRLLDDLARVASGALGAFTGMRHEVEGRLKAQFERILGSMDLVTREEFEAVRAMAQAARESQAELAERLSRLEETLDGEALRPAPPKRPRPKKPGEAPESESAEG